MCEAPLPAVPATGTGTTAQAEYQPVNPGDRPPSERGLFPERLTALSLKARPHPHPPPGEIYISSQTTLKSEPTPNTTRSSASNEPSRDGDSS